MFEHREIDDYEKYINERQQTHVLLSFLCYIIFSFTKLTIPFEMILL